MECDFWKLESDNLSFKFCIVDIYQYICCIIFCFKVVKMILEFDVPLVWVSWIEENPNHKWKAVKVPAASVVCWWQGQCICSAWLCMTPVTWPAPHQAEPVTSEDRSLQQLGQARAISPSTKLQPSRCPFELGVRSRHKRDVEGAVFPCGRW